MTNGHYVKDFRVERIVLKDLSFETPMGQAVYAREWQPAYQVDLALQSAPLVRKNFWEVVLSATVSAQLDDRTAFLVEAHQAAVIEAAGLEPEALRQVLAIEAPRLIFPYLRESVDSVAARGGFPSPCLQLPDFEQWYADVKAKKSSPGEQSGTDDASLDDADGA